MKKSDTKARIRGYFERNPKAVTISTLAAAFPGIKLVTINYHLTSLLKEQFIHKPKRGTYQFSKDFVSPQDKRNVVDHHIRANGSRIQPGAHWKPGMEALTEGVNPIAFATLGAAFGESIIVRMEAAGFTQADVRFVQSLIDRVFALPEKL
ncbi:MAG TPA: hypothetical protein VIX83_07735 [Candidatus Cybelea sp.]